LLHLFVLEMSLLAARSYLHVDQLSPPRFCSPILESNRDMGSPLEAIVFEKEIYGGNSLSSLSGICPPGQYYICVGGI
jgi:hypothetical protein